MESTLLFPGQGAYHRGTLTELTSATPAAAAALEEIDDAVRPLIGRSIVDALLASPPPDLDELLSGDPELLQLGIYATSVALFAALQARGARPTRHVGHSFGEIAALVCAGAFTAGEGAELVHHRTRALIDAAVADGYMAALGLDSARAEGLVALLADPEIVVAVENRPTQTVLSGARAPMDRAGEVARGLAVSFIPLKSPYPFHSPLLARASADFAARISHLRARPLQVPVYSPILGRDYHHGEDIPALLAAHLCQRVRFAAALEAIYQAGGRTFIECGARDALCAAVSGTLRDPAVKALAPAAVDGAVWFGPVDSALGLIRPPAPPRAASADPGAGAAANGHVGGLNGHVGAAPDGIVVLGQALLPGLRPEEFAQYWVRHGGRLRDFASLLRSGDQPDPLAASAPLAAPAAPFAPAAQFAPAAPAQAYAPSEAAAPVEGFAPAAQFAPVGGSAPDRAGIVDRLVEVYAAALEYPTEVFGEDIDLEAELGVDSVKQTELLGTVSAEFGLPERPPGFRIAEYNTIGKIADLITGSLDGGPPGAEPAGDGALGGEFAPAAPAAPSPAAEFAPAQAYAPFAHAATAADFAPPAPAQAYQSFAPAAPGAEFAPFAPAASENGFASFGSVAPTAEFALSVQFTPVGGSAPDRAGIVGRLVEVYAAALEYPTEVFGEDVDLEAELGVDSVKQTELLGTVSAEFGLPERPPGFRIAEYNTIGKIADLVSLPA